MADFEDLDPQTRCFALVGRFLQAWSVMENSLHAAIGAALSIEDIKLRILCANIRFRDKTNILSTLVDVAPYLAPTDKERLRKDLREIADYSPTRNMMAHDPFQPDSSQKGVEFLTVKAKGKFDLPTTVWEPEKFQAECERVNKYREFLDGVAKLFAAQPLPPTNYAAALQRFVGGFSLPMMLPMTPGRPNHPFRLTPTDPGSNPTTGETSAQIPPEPEE